MFENIAKFFRKLVKAEKKEPKSKDSAKERLHLVLMQDRANVSADFLDLMKQEIIEVIKKYIDIDENAIDVRLTNKTNEDGTNGAPALYANIPIVSIKEEAKKKAENESEEKPDKKEEKKDNNPKTEETKGKEEEKKVKEKEEQTDKKEETKKEEKPQQKEELKKEEKQENIEEKEEKEDKAIEEKKGDVEATKQIDTSSN